MRTLIMADYKFFNNMVGSDTAGVIYKGKLWIPKDEDNTDWQDYLEWAKTNTADPAD